MADINKEKKIIQQFKDLQRDDWLKKYMRFNQRLFKKYETQLYSDAHKKEWEKVYKGVLMRWRKKWKDIFEIDWGTYTYEK